jgi:epidermal growth factor receptor substrate 15
VFDDFDSSFAPVSSAGTRAATSNAGGAGFSFDDAFDPTPRSAASAAPAVPPRRSDTGTSLSAPAVDTTPSPALPDDAGQVKQLTSMGFARHQVIAALEKSNYRTDRALERLLAGK